MEGNAPPKLSSISELDDVRLIVKSANQQFDDLIVHSDPSWTIRRLKLHLSQVYPSNPAVPEQKLIYSGQLLTDELILKDILRSYKDVETENHIFHLVYQPKISATKPKLQESQPLLNNKKIDTNLEKPTTPVIPASIAADGLRHRNISSTSSSSVQASTSASTSASAATSASASTPASASASTSAKASESSSTPSTSKQANAPQPTAATTSQPQIPNMAYPFSIPCPNFFSTMPPFIYPGQYNNGAVTEQQIALQNTVHQIYANYIEQCLKMANEMLNATQTQSTAPSIPMFMPMPQYMQQSFPTLHKTTPTAASSSVPPPEFDKPGTSQAARANFAPRIIPVIPPTTQQPQPAAATPTDGTAAAPAPATAPSPTPAPAPAPAPAENVAQPQPRFPNIVQEEQENPDWLDSFYSITRLLALLTLVYFYSSPLRCLVVAIIAFGIYLYHIGFFHTRRTGQAAANNRNLNNNQNINENNAPGGDAAQAQNDPQVATEANQNTAGDSEPLISSVTPPETETSTTSLIAFVRTFVVSFFASLLPETPAL